MKITELKKQIRSARYYGYQEDLDFLRYQTVVPLEPRGHWLTIFNRLMIHAVDVDREEDL